MGNCYRGINKSEHQRQFPNYRCPVSRGSVALLFSEVERMVGIRAQELCESRGGRPGLPSLLTYGFCGRKATLNQLISVYVSETFSREYITHAAAADTGTACLR